MKGVPAEERKEPKAAKAPATESVSKEAEKSTFGDLSVLSALKEQFEESEKKGKK
ncbi:hypothetical protein D3C86_1921860 [compost metagenome]